MTVLTKVFGPTPQKEPVFGRESEMVKTHESGYAFAVDNWKRLERFLVLGTDGGSFYVKERELSIENASVVIQCIQEDIERTINKIVEMGTTNRVVRQTPCIFALAMCFSYGSFKNPDLNKRKKKNLDFEYKSDALNKVVRTGTHILTFVGFIKQMRGFGRGIKRLIMDWYESKEITHLAYQCVKYQKREKWSHRDVLRLCHPYVISMDYNALYNWITHPGEELKEMCPPIVRIMKSLHEPDADVAKIISENRYITREMVPTEKLTDPKVQIELLKDMPMTALIRNLANLTRISVYSPLGDHTQTAVKRLTDQEYMIESHVNPLQLLAALSVYKSGKGEKGSHTWVPVQEIVTALEKAFELSWGLLPKIDKRVYCGVDVSSSMGWNYMSNVGGITAMEGAAAMALLFHKCTSRSYIRKFNHNLAEFNLGSYEEVMESCSWDGGGTDCALPMIDATEKKLPVDAFVVLTDDETGTNAYSIHPFQALKEYRRQSGIDAKLVVVSMVPNEFSIADPKDPGMLDIVGFDTAIPSVISKFIEN